MSMFTPPIRRVDRGRGHSYVDANGVKVPGVTSILSDGLAKPALISWAANVTAEYAVDHWDDLTQQAPSKRLATLKKARYDDRDQAARRGTDVHTLAEQLADGQEVTVPDELAGHVDAYIRFLDDWHIEPVLNEATVISFRHGWAGTLDLVADIPPLDQRALLDIKTSRSGLFSEVCLQLAAYRHGDVWIDDDGAERPMPKIDACYGVHVRADGYSLIPVIAGPTEYRIFRYAQQLADFADTGRDLIGEELTPPRLLEATS
jgi:hypothetical protein